MEFVPVPNGVQVEMRYSQNSQRCENTLWFRAGAPTTTTLLSELCGVLYSWWGSNMRPLIGNDVQLREIYASDQASRTGAEFTYTPTPPAFGDASTNCTTSSITLAVAFRTGQRGRSYRGRNYAVGIPQGQVNKDIIQPAYANALQQAYAQLLTIELDVTAQWCVVSKRANGAARVSGILTPVLSVSLVDNTVDNQRRRLTGRGE